MILYPKQLCAVCTSTHYAACGICIYYEFESFLRRMENELFLPGTGEEFVLKKELFLSSFSQEPESTSAAGMT